MPKDTDNPIVQHQHPALRAKAAEVPVDEISSPKIQEVINTMKKALSSQKDGVAIAAPQIGISLRIFVVSGIVLNSADNRYPVGEDTVYINPKITKISKETHEVEEGCLSVRWLYGKVKRATKATIRAYDEHGKVFERGASGLLAQVFQHETDHLDGILFIDHAYDLEEVPPESGEKVVKSKITK
jgi:peptide deformylase